MEFVCSLWEEIMSNKAKNLIQGKWTNSINNKSICKKCKDGAHFSLSRNSYNVVSRHGRSVLGKKNIYFLIWKNKYMCML